MTDSTVVQDGIRRQAARARWAVGLLAVACVVDVAAVLSDLGQASLLRGAVEGVEITTAAAEANDARQQAMAGLQFLLLVPTAIVFLMWLHRAYANLGDVGARVTRFSPGWAVGYWFIPVANLIRPYQVVKEAWQRSESMNASESTDTAPSSPVVGLWWMAFIGSGALGRVFAARLSSADTVEALLSASWWVVAADASSAVSAVLAILVVRGIDRRQRRMVDVSAAPGPSPAPSGAA
ncbi:MAG TPA: DUF4328 domain-containing protein [Longimicrobiales bacterium]